MPGYAKGYNTCGIYKITIGPYYYYGQADCLKRRANKHINDLKSGRRASSNPKMQAIFNKYGESQYSFTPMLYCAPEHLDMYEQRFIDKYISDPYCMNLSIAASAPMRGRKHTEETRKRMSIANSGRKPTPEHVEKAIAPKRKAVICTTTGQQYISVSEASRQLGIDMSSIAKVCRKEKEAAEQHHFIFAAEAA